MAPLAFEAAVRHFPRLGCEQRSGRSGKCKYRYRDRVREGALRGNWEMHGVGQLQYLVVQMNEDVRWSLRVSEAGKECKACYCSCGTTHDDDDGWVK